MSNEMVDTVKKSLQKGLKIKIVFIALLFLIESLFFFN